jgi:hypothetical protein
MIEFWRSAIRQQFHAAIDMLGNAIEACPETVWAGRGRFAFWSLAYHTSRGAIEYAVASGNRFGAGLGVKGR